MSAREALFIAVGFCGALLAALILTLITLGSSDRHLQDRLIALQRATDDDRVKQLQTLLEEAKKREAELKRAHDRETSALKALERARTAEAEARKQAEAAYAARAGAAESAAAERIAAAEKAAQEKIAAVEKSAADKAAKIASAAPASGGAPSTGEQLFEQAAAIEKDSKGAEAVRMYTRAARSGNGKAAKRLGEIYGKGLPDVPMNYAESLKWFNTARALGEEVSDARR